MTESTIKDQRKVNTILTAVVPLDAIDPHPCNYNRHNDAQIESLRQSLRLFNYVRRIVVQVGENGRFRCVAGHGLMTAAKLEGYTELECTVIPTTWPEAKVLAYLTADNETARGGDPDITQLQSIIDEVAAWQTETGQGSLTAIGLSDQRLRQIRQAAMTAVPEASKDAAPQLDRAEALRQEWGTAPGQLWRLPSQTSGHEHRLICGDSRETAVVARLLGTDKPLLMVTDPPYGVEYDPTWRATAGINKNQGKLGKIHNDDNADWSAAWQLFTGDVVYVYHAGAMARIVQQSLEGTGFEIRAQIIWAKDRMALSRGDYHWQHEPIWYAVRKGAKGHRTDDRTQTTLWTIPAREDSGHGHGSQKPLECMQRPIRNHTIDLVYDPFCGSGTTLIAAENLGRQCRAIELDPGYVAIALQRYQDAFGMEPTLL